MNSEIKLKINNVSKSFAKVDTNQTINAVSDINIEMSNNDFVCLVGPSGCGKSTILRLISGLITPTTGEILLNDEKISGPTDKIAMVFQKPTLYPWLTVYDNIAFGLKIHKVSEDIIKEKVENMIDFINLNDFKYSFPSELSGGMAQRVALARAIVNDPKAILFDEPLVALDAFTRMKMQDEMISIWTRKKQLAIMVTHDIEEAVYMSTKIVVIDKNPGRIKKIIDIDMPYKRDRESMKFIEYRNEILSLLKESIK